MEIRNPHSDAAVVRVRLDLRGQVQGVGFRPFVYRLASRSGLTGFVYNDSNGAAIEVEGPAERVAAFEQALHDELPPLARVTSVARAEIPTAGAVDFRIQHSQRGPDRRPEVTPDAATCRDCRREVLDPQDRRYWYPFINCTNCGPRYSIIRDVPYDRPQTTMAAFTMCERCQCEYDDPADRRFHAQPNACAACGPQLEVQNSESRIQSAECRIQNSEGRVQNAEFRIRRQGVGPSFPLPLREGLGEGSSGLGSGAIRIAAQMLAEGAILAIKGIGGYHLACRADDEAAVARLRERKLRDGKPLAIMVAEVAAAREIAHLNPADEDALRSPAAPIVLATKRDPDPLAPSIAPGCGDHGVMLAYAPVHHLLFAAGLGPLVMTSANLSGQPLTYRDADAQRELGDVADAFLLHDREICRPIDDSVVFTFRDEVVPLRRARGYAPRPLRIAPDMLPEKAPRILAVGAELKATVALLDGDEVIVSEHLGDLSNAAAYRHFTEAIARLTQLAGFTPNLIAHDLHPQYLSTQYARQQGLPTVAVQHHHAHIASVMAEWGECGPVVGIACDGTGYGSDGAVWGGEILLCERGTFERCGHLSYFPLVGGDQAAIDTWRPAAALLQACDPKHWRDLLMTSNAGDAPDEAALRTFEQQRRAGVNAPPTSSLGRVFDAASYVLGLCSRNRHEAEAAMALEAAARGASADVAPFEIETRNDDGVLQVSMARTIAACVAARRQGTPVNDIAACFHETVARALVTLAEHACQWHRVCTIALSGGCFANRRLLQRTVALLEQRGRRVIYHRHVPCGDGGLALGQALVAAWQD